MCRTVAALSNPLMRSLNWLFWWENLLIRSSWNLTLSLLECRVQKPCISFGFCFWLCFFLAASATPVNICIVHSVSVYTPKTYLTDPHWHQLVLAHFSIRCIRSGSKYNKLYTLSIPYCYQLLASTSLISNLTLHLGWVYTRLRGSKHFLDSHCKLKGVMKEHWHM